MVGNNIHGSLVAVVQPFLFENVESRHFAQTVGRMKVDSGISTDFWKA